MVDSRLGSRFRARVLSLALVAALPVLVHAQSPRIRIIGGDTVADSGSGPQVAVFSVDVFFNYPLITCQPSQPDCNTKRVPVCVDFRTVAETATAGEDFVPDNGTLSKTLVFSEPGDLSLGTIAVQIIGDSITEPEETFKVVLSSSTTGCRNEAALEVREARATIVDGAPAGPGRPDLLVSKIALLADCKIELTLTNAGPGNLPDAAYHPTNGVAIQLRRNNQAWGGIRLAGVDPQKKLRNAGGSIKHIWFPSAANLRLIKGFHTLAATIDRFNAVAEENESNNQRVTRVFCGR